MQRSSALLQRSGELLQRSSNPLARAVRFVAGNLKKAHRTDVNPQAGFALLVVTVTVAFLGAVVSEFGYNARIEYESAANARDSLRAEYLARSGINLSRILIKVQMSVIDKLNAQLGGTDFQVSDFAPFLLGAFGGSDEEKKEMGGALGAGGSLKGISLGKGGTFDVVFEDDTMPGGPIQRTITYEAPFNRCDREADYAQAWAEFKRRGR